ncbi:hypothetical protein [Chitinivorax sp. B]|uniref:hypothetical protein n=1 Tax=Chitinivorax sp. B TaxID=2502235 RepID=UPI0010F50F7D|nr:hypothetical protein [Chitinivorax sp. B]
MGATFKCPHCHVGVPDAAKVCPGCNAEIEYGTPMRLKLLIVSLVAIIGLSGSAELPESLIYIAWIIGIVIGLGLLALARRFFANRVAFKRVYKMPR